MNKALPAALGTALTAAFVLFAILAEPAHADVLLTDLVLGTSAQERGLTIEEMPDILATHAIIMRPDGSAYYEREANSPIKIASTTKVMTALVALDHCDPSETLTVDHAAATVGESCVGLKEGDTLTLEQALTGLMVMSGNDVATAIATHVGGKIDPASSDPYGTFIKAMNDRAAQLGCTDTLFENPHGLDFGAWVGNLHKSCVGLKEGDTLTLEQALTGLMVMSGNDVATAIATHVGGKIDPASSDPYGTFIKAMNDRAAQLGCTDTLFENPHGLDFGAWVGNLHSTAHDVTRIWAEAWRNEAFRSFACSGATGMHVTSADGSATSPQPTAVRAPCPSPCATRSSGAMATLEARRAAPTRRASASCARSRASPRARCISHSSAQRATRSASTIR